MKTMNINHNERKIIQALGIDDDQIRFVANTIEKIVDRSLTYPEYSKSNSLQDIITCGRIRANEDPLEPITEKEILLVYTAWQLGLLQNQVQDLLHLQGITKELQKLISTFK